MGVVYLAKDTKLGRAVALKFLPPQWCHDEGAKQRFLREAQAASATNHKNICIIHDIEETEDGQLFIVMAHYEGQTLKQKLERGALPAGEAVDVAGEIAEGLAKAHAQGVVHRDIKPGNIMVTDDGVKILDFGLAKLADAALKLTVEGSTLGTVAYMSPEQARGEEADERSDIWALGVVLYEMLSGECPFKGSYPEALFYAIKNEEPAPLAAKVKDLPDGVEPIVRRALAKDPAERYQHARELARELRFLQGRSLPLDLRTGPVPVPGSATAVRRKPRVLAWVVAAAAVLAIAVLIGYLWLARPLPRTPIAVVPVANHTGELELDGYRLALTQSLIAELEDSPNLRASPYPRILEVLRPFLSGKGDVSSSNAIQVLASEAGASVLVVPALQYQNGALRAHADIRNAATGATMSTIDTDAMASSLLKDTAQRLTQQLAARIQSQFKVRWPHRPSQRPAGGRFRNLDAARAFEQGSAAYEQMEYATALAAFKSAVDLDPQRAVAHAWLSRTALMMGDLNSAETAGRAAIQLVIADTPRADTEFAGAVLAESQGDFDKAEARYRALMDLYPDASAAHAELADFLKRRVRNGEAVDAYHEALARDAGSVRLHVDLCQVYVRLDDSPLAERHARAALTAYRRVGNQGGEAQGLLCLGDLQRRQGGPGLAEAKKNIEAARDLFTSLGYSYGLSRVYQYLGATAGDSGNYPLAVKHFEAALSRSRQVGNRVTEALELMNLGVSYIALGQRATALTYYQQARDFYQRMGDERRAAEQEVNIANLLMNSASERTEVLRRLDAARATLHRLGAVEFELFAMQVKGVNSVYAGDSEQGIRELRAALNIAKERNLSVRVVSLTVKLAEAYFLAGDYQTAKALLQALVATDAGKDDLQTHIYLGRIAGRLGDVKSADAHLQRALAGIQAAGQMELAPVAHLTRGEVAYELGDIPAARAHLEQAAALWVDDLPDAASVEARCLLGMLEAREGRQATARPMIDAGINQARKMGRKYLEDRCRDNPVRSVPPSIVPRR